ncbi:MAG: hypothetical protein IT366_16035 [Candidatus Hydrogenedentes bacterium]|nr:hypothetical protein [Candidatus Hydrogenedentota bacterium]
MSRGCVIALVVFGVSVLLLVVLLLVVPLYVFDIIDSAPRVPVASFVTNDTVAAIALDPNHEQFIAMMDQRGSPMSYFLPHEAGVVVDLDPMRKKRTVTIAGSPKHLGPAFMMMFNEVSKAAIEVSEKEGDTPGIDTWLTKSLTREKGAIILRGEGAVDAESEALAGKHWPEVAPRTGVKLEGGHAIEIVMQNHSGEAILALEPFYRIERQSAEPLEHRGEPSTETAAPLAEAQVAEASVTASGAEAMAEAQLPLDTEVAKTEQSTEGGEATEEQSAGPLLELASELSVIGDFTETGDFKILVTARAKDAASAEKSKKILDDIREASVRDVEDDEISVTGDTKIAGEVVTGEFIFSGFKERMGKWLDDMERSQKF